MKKLKNNSRIDKNKEIWKNRIVVGTPTTGLLRMEWALARWPGQTIPTSWTTLDFNAWISAYMPMYYLVPDAQNLIVKFALDNKAEWVLLLEQDNLIPSDTYIRLNEYMMTKEVPIVSALYFTKTTPPEPLIYRGRGWGYYGDWKLGDKVWADGVPTGVLLIHSSILKEMWNDSPEYMCGDIKTRRVFEIPNKRWVDPESQSMKFLTGTSDLAWCTRVMEGKYFEKAGWPKFQKMKYPFLVDTNIFSRHIDELGNQYPDNLPKEFIDGKISWTQSINEYRKRKTIGK